MARLPPSRHSCIAAYGFLISERETIPPSTDCAAIVLDNGPIHVSKAALAERAHWLTVERLNKYAPNLYDIEEVWGNLKAIISPTKFSQTPTSSMRSSITPSRR
jgi:hypothetical protein